MAFASAESSSSDSSDIADRKPPVIVDDRVDSDARLDTAARRGYTLPANPQSQANTPPPIPPPGREQDTEAGIDEDRRALPEEPVRRFSVEFDRARFGCVEQAPERRVETRRAAEVGEKGLLRIGR